MAATEGWMNEREKKFRVELFYLCSIGTCVSHEPVQKNHDKYAECYHVAHMFGATAF